MISDKSLYIIYFSILITFLVFTLFSGRLKLSQALKYALIWLGIFSFVFLGYAYQDLLLQGWSQVKGELMPYSAIEHKDGSVSFTRAEDGHFHIEALVEGKPVRFMVDTGATRTILTLDDAQRLGIDQNNLTYNQLTETANGKVFDAAIRVSEMKVGPIIIRNIRASVSRNMEGYSLLGMSFLEKLKGYKVEGNRLTLWN